MSRALAPGSADNAADAAQEEAMSRALAALLDAGGYNRSADFFAATRTLNLARIRDLHTRAMQMSSAGVLVDIAAERLVELDPAAALAYVRSVGDGQTLSDPAYLVAWWAWRTPEAAIEEGMKNPLSGKGRQLLKFAFRGLAENDPAGAASRLSLISDPKSRGEVLEACLTSWARRDPVQAAKWVQAHPESYATGSEGNDAIAKFAGTLAMRDPALARDFAQTLEEPLRGQALRHATQEWAMQEPKVALAWCMEHGVSVDLREDIPGTQFARSILSSAMGRAPGATLDWLESIPAETRAKLAPEALMTASADLAAKIFAFIAEEDQPEYAYRLMLTLNRRRAGDAMKWAAKLPEGPVRVAALSDLMGRYVFDDPVKEIEKFAAGRSRDAAYVSHVERAARSGTAPDVSLLPKIADPEMRAEAAGAIYRAWRRTEPDAADRWLSTTPHLPAEAKRRLGGK